MADQAVTGHLHGVHRADHAGVLRGLVEIREGGLFVGDGDVGAGGAERGQPPQRRFQAIPGHPEPDIAPVEPQGGERRVVEPGREASPNRVSDDPDDRGRPVDLRMVPPIYFANRGSQISERASIYRCLHAYPS